MSEGAITRLLEAADEADLSGHYALAAEILDTLIAAARADGRDGEVLVGALTRRAALARYTGNLDLADAALAEAMGVIVSDPSIDVVHAAALHLERGLALLETSGPDAADEHLDRAAEVGSTIPEGRARTGARIPALAALAASRRLRGDYGSAEALLHEALGMAEAARDQDPRDRRAASELIHVLDDLGVLYKFAGRFAESEATYLRAEALLIAMEGPDHPDMATIQHNLGGLAHARGDGAAALPFARRAVDLHERTLGADHLATVLDRSALAAVLDQLGRSVEAEALLHDCAERLERTVGPDHREVAVVINNLAAIAQRDGRLDEARDLYARAVAIKERALGPDSPSVGITLNNLATVERRLGRLDEAAALYERALDIVLASAGPEHPLVSRIRGNMARVLGGRTDRVSER